ncbi:MAG: metallophosphoesterase family protein [candidate division WOR-3 bacterium]|uniref:Metallophosphoesterase n=1 Tax=candidate division WOR-3 bacterium TaxID=2052148 RepID=A0A7C3ELC8_UNCW3|nr:metallophosphoesterase family protein [candidate division WOR-3 bacterium]
MRIGIFSDVHSNLEALVAVLSFFREKEVQWLLCCGDVVGYGPNPEKCIELVRISRAKVVAGNHDWAVAGRIGIGSFNSIAAQAVRWTQTRLKEQEISYLRNLPLTEDVGPFHLVHSAPSSPSLWEYITTLEDAEEEMGSFIADICFIGHTHIPFAVERISGRQARIITGSSFELRPDAKYLINVGSVGQPRNGDPRACCLVIDWDERRAEFHRLKYDFTITQKKITTAGLPAFLAERLATGT